MASYTLKNGFLHTRPGPRSLCLFDRSNKAFLPPGTAIGPEAYAYCKVLWRGVCFMSEVPLYWGSRSLPETRRRSGQEALYTGLRCIGVSLA